MEYPPFTTAAASSTSATSATSSSSSICISIQPAQGSSPPPSRTTDHDDLLIHLPYDDEHDVKEGVDEIDLNIDDSELNLDRSKVTRPAKHKDEGLKYSEYDVKGGEEEMDDSDDLNIIDDGRSRGTRPAKHKDHNDDLKYSEPDVKERDAFDIDSYLIKIDASKITRPAKHKEHKDDDLKFSEQDVKEKEKETHSISGLGTQGTAPQKDSNGLHRSGGDKTDFEKQEDRIETTGPDTENTNGHHTIVEYQQEMQKRRARRRKEDARKNEDDDDDHNHNEESDGKDNSSISDDGMRGSVLGKLPPLQAIGRSQSIDLDEPPPPDLEDEFDALAAEYEAQGVAYQYQADHAPQTAARMAQGFQVLQPGGHVSKTSPSHVPLLAHCRYSVDFADRYAELRTLLESRARLQLQHDYTTRIHAAAIFAAVVEKCARDEFTTWRQIQENTLTAAPATKLESLAAVCEELYLHMQHWNSVRTRVHTDVYLRGQLPSLARHLSVVKRTLLEIRDRTVFWLRCLIECGFRVLAHCDTAHLTQEILFAITRGLEEYNNIVSEIMISQSSESHSATSSSSSLQSSSSSLSSSSSSHHPSIGNNNTSTQPMSFLNVLNLLAYERAKYAAAMTHQFYSASDDFLSLILRTRLPEYTWGEEVIRPGARTSQSSGAVGAVPVGMGSTSDTSDYHTGSQVSLSTAMLRVSGITAPDLSRQMSPIVDFTRREQEFAGKFFHIVCTSTSLLKKKSSSGGLSLESSSSAPAAAAPTPRTKRVSLRYQNHPRAADLTPPPASTLRTRSDNDMLTPLKADKDPQLRGSKSMGHNARKSVSWGDSEQVSIIQQLTQKYLDLMWSFFGKQLMDFFVAPVHGGVDATQGQLGNIHLCKDIVTILIVRMIQQTCLKDIFPPGAVLPLTTIAKQLHAEAAWAAWDQGLCLSVASRTVDKCYPTLLVHGEYSTATGKLLRDVYQPLHSVIHNILHNFNNNGPDSSNGGDDKTNKEKGLELALAHSHLLVPTLQRLLITSDVAQRWCEAKINHFLSTWSLAPFLLVSQSDLKLISDESRYVLFDCQKVCGGSNKPNRGATAAQTLALQQMSHAWDTLNDSIAQMQTLSGQAVKQYSESCSKQAWDFFDDNMPTGKVWRKKSSTDLPSEHQAYVEHALDTLLEPVISGLDKLKTSAQISAVSMATTAVCEAWTDFILKHKIRFSLHGANQLSLDFQRVRTYLQLSLQDDTVRHSVLALAIFKYLAGAVELLKRQPRRGGGGLGGGVVGAQGGTTRHQQQYRDDTIADRPLPSKKPRTSPYLEGRAYKVAPLNPVYDDDNSCDLSSSSSQQWTSTSIGGTVGDAPSHNSLHNGSSTSPEHSDAAITALSSVGAGANAGSGDYKIPQKEQWLALRVHGGARHWPKLPSCFNSNQ